MPIKRELLLDRNREHHRKETISEHLNKAVLIAVLAFGVSSMVAVGASLAVRQILDVLRNGKCVGHCRQILP